jgi:fibronectin type 3 domain-containing protein
MKTFATEFTHLVLLTTVSLACWLCPAGLEAAPAITYVQGNYAAPQTPQTLVSVAYAAGQASGDLNVVVVGWNDSTAVVSAVTDSSGNTYTLAVGPTVQSGYASQSIYYAPNIISAAAGTNTVTVSFATAARSADIRIFEYSGADTINPVDATAANSGNSTTSSSGSVNTTNATDLIFGANLVQTLSIGPGGGFTQRLLTSPDGDIAEDQMVAAPGNYSASAPLSTSGPWIMQVIAFRTPAIGYVQGNSATPQGPQSTVSVAYAAGQVAGDLNVVVVGWNDSTAVVGAVTDSSGNTYTLAVGPTVQNGFGSQSMYYAPSIVSAAAGTNTVTVTFASAAAFPDIRILEYSGADPINPVDASAANFGNSTTSNSGSANTTNATDLILGASLVQTQNVGPGVGFTQRLLTVPDGDIVEDQMVAAAGSYSASTPVSPSGPWIMQMVALRTPVAAAASVTTSTTSPTVNSVSANSGPTAGGTAVTISGTNFAAGATVAFGGAAATNVVVVSGTQITATTPPGTVGAATVTVTNPGAQSGSLPNGFTYAAPATPAISYVQDSSTVLDTIQTTVSVAYTAGQVAGDLNVVVVGWNDSTAEVAAVTDSIGNPYTLAVGPTVQSGLASQAIYYAPNIASAAAGTNVVTVTFASAATAPDIRILEYSGADPINPVDATSANMGNSAASDSGSATTTNATDLIFGANLSQAASIAPGLGFTQRPLTWPDGNVLEDEIVTATGSYDASATLGVPAPWIMQMVAFRTPVGNTAPAAPGNLTATAAGATQINLSWTVSTSGLGVADYVVQRCQGTGCTSFVQVATVAGTNYTDTGLLPSTSYSYQVQAVDTAGNTSTLSNTATAATLAPPPPTAPGNLTATAVSASQISLSWTGSASSYGIAYYVVQRCQGAGCTNFTLIATLVGTSYTDTGLLPSTSYSYLVQAVDVIGNASMVSNIAAAATLAPPPPTAPGNLTATAASASQINLSWTASTSGVGIAYYVVQRCQGAGCANLAQIATLTGTNYTDTGLLSSTIYSYLVQAVDVIGNASAFSTMATAATQAPPPPTAPGNLTATAASATQISLSWTASTSSVGIADYVVQRCQGAGCTSFAQIAALAGTTYLDTGLISNTSYSYQVQAADTAGNAGAFSNMATAVTQAWQPPTAPGNLTATAAGPTQINVSWTASTSSAGLANYIVQRCQGADCTEFAQIATPVGTSYSDTGLLLNASYSYQVQAIDTAGNLSPDSIVATLITGSLLPLRESPNSRYLVRQDGTPFLIMGDSPQALVGNLGSSDMATYMADRAKLGFNSLWVNLLCASYTGCNSNGTTYDGVAPFTSGSNPSTYDLSTPNSDYFSRVDSMVNLALTYNLVVFLDPIETGGWVVTLENNGGAQAYNYGVYIGNRYKNFANIVWLHGNDFQSWSSNSSDNNLVQQVMAGIASVDSNHLQTIELNYDSSYSNQDSVLGSLLTLDSAYTYYETYDMVLQSYNSSPTIPTYLVESNYEYENNTGALPGNTGPYVLREQAYWTMLSGGTGQIYGNHYVWMFATGWQSFLDSPGALEIQYVNQLFGSVPWWELVPDSAHAVVTAGYGNYDGANQNLTTATYCTTSWITDGSLALTYCPNAATLTVDLGQFSGTVTAQWYDPSNGTYSAVSGAPFTNSGSQDFTTPGNNHDGNPDWVLVLKSIS